MIDTYEKLWYQWSKEYFTAADYLELSAIHQHVKLFITRGMKNGSLRWGVFREIPDPVKVSEWTSEPPAIELIVAPADGNIIYFLRAMFDKEHEDVLQSYSFAPFVPSPQDEFRTIQDNNFDEAMSIV